MDDISLNQELKFLNNTNKAIKIYLEPWGEDKILESGNVARIKFGNNLEDKSLEIEYSDEALTLYFPSGTIAEFFDS